MPRSENGKYPKQISFQIDEELFARVREVSVKQGAPVSWILRKALREWLERKGF